MRERRGAVGGGADVGEGIGSGSWRGRSSGGREEAEERKKGGGGVDEKCEDEKTRVSSTE